jgi:hypothetical protein
MGERMDVLSKPLTGWTLLIVIGVVLLIPILVGIALFLYHGFS